MHQPGSIPIPGEDPADAQYIDMTRSNSFFSTQTAMQLGGHQQQLHASAQINRVSTSSYSNQQGVQQGMQPQVYAHPQAGFISNPTGGPTYSNQNVAPLDPQPQFYAYVQPNFVDNSVGVMFDNTGRPYNYMTGPFATTPAGMPQEHAYYAPTPRASGNSLDMPSHLSAQSTDPQLSGSEIHERDRTSRAVSADDNKLEDDDGADLSDSDADGTGTGVAAQGEDQAGVEVGDGSQDDVVDGIGKFGAFIGSLDEAKGYATHKRHFVSLKDDDDDVDEVEKNIGHHAGRIFEAMTRLSDSAEKTYKDTFKTIKKKYGNKQNHFEACAYRIVGRVIEVHRHGSELLAKCQLDGTAIDQIKASDRIDALVLLLEEKKNIVKDILDGWKFNVIVDQPSRRLKRAKGTQQGNCQKKQNFDRLTQDNKDLRAGKTEAAGTVKSTGSKGKRVDKQGTVGNKDAAETKRAVGLNKTTRESAEAQTRKKATPVRGQQKKMVEESEPEHSEMESEVAEPDESEDEKIYGADDSDADESEVEGESKGEEDEADESEGEEIDPENSKAAPPQSNSVNTPHGHLRLGGKSVEGYVPSEGFRAGPQVPSRGGKKRKELTSRSQKARGGYNLRKRQKN